RRATSTSSRMRSTSSRSSVLIALGSNLGARPYNIRRAIHALRGVMRVVRVSTIRETEPVDAPPPKYLNAVVAGYTSLSPEELLDALLRTASPPGPVRRGIRTEPRLIDLDLIFHGGHRVCTEKLTLPPP